MRKKEKEKMEETTARLSFGKDVDSIETPPLVPEDWWLAEIRELPEAKPNKARQNDPESEKAGNNWVVPVKLVSDEPEFDGRFFTIFFPMPKPGDEDRRTPMGQTIEDACIVRIRDFVVAFGGEKAGSDVSVRVGARGMVYVEQQIVNGEPRNGVNVFRGFKSALSGSGAAAFTD
jgi:hypothetical protein